MKSNLIRFLIVQALWLITQGAALADTKYEVWRSTSNNSATAQRIANNVSGTSYDDTSVSSGQTYYYWIKVRTDVTAWASKFIVYDFLYVTNYLICPTSARRGSRSEIITATDFSGPIGDLTVTWNLKEKDVLFHAPMATWSKTVFMYDNFTVLRA